MADRIAISDRAVAWALADLFEAPHRTPIERASEDMPLGESVRVCASERKAIVRGRNFDSSGLLQRLTGGGL